MVDLLASFLTASMDARLGGVQRRARVSCEACSQQRRGPSDLRTALRPSRRSAHLDSHRHVLTHCSSQPPSAKANALWLFRVPRGIFGGSLAWVLVSVQPKSCDPTVSGSYGGCFGSWLAAEQEVRALLFGRRRGRAVQGSAGIGGPPVVAIALTPRKCANQRATAVVMTAVAMSAIPPLAWYGLPLEVMIGVVLIPVARRNRPRCALLRIRRAQAV